MSRDSSNIEVHDLLAMAELEKEQWQRQSIYKLPEWVKGPNNKAYTPQVMSFGPYHCKNKKLAPMERHKDRAMNRFLKRSGLSYEDCLRSLSEIKGELMNTYDWLDSKLQENSDAFLNLMIRDGIFMLEIFSDWEKESSDYAYNDPIFSKHGHLHVVPHIERDMLLLENQIPMEVLHRLYRTQCEVTEEDANKLVFQFFFRNMKESTAPTNSLHILDMIRTVMLGSYPQSTPKKEGSAITNRSLRSAIKLDEAGIKIKKSKTICLRDISFQKSELWLPEIVISDVTEPLFLNLMAYERFHIQAGNDVTNYVFFMGSLIEYPKDVMLLRSKDIIHIGIGSSDRAAMTSFHSWSKDISPDEDCPLGTIFEEANAYCERIIPKYRAALVVLYLTYFKGKWAIISVLAGFILFVLTTTQTVYAIREFYKKN